MSASNHVNRTGIAFCIAAFGLILVCVGIIRAFEGSGHGLEILSAIGLFAFAASFARGFLSPPILSIASALCLAIPLMN
jgi:hypothetical protein